MLRKVAGSLLLVSTAVFLTRYEIHVVLLKFHWNFIDFSCYG